MPLPDHDRVVADYETLLKMEFTGTDSCWPGGADHDYSVRELLDGVDTPEERAERSERARAGDFARGRRTSAIEVFYSYSHKDEIYREKLETHLALLRRQGVIRDRHDRRIAPGEEWAGVIDDRLRSAQIILLLISADFIASDYCYDVEMKLAMERDTTGEARVIPIIVRKVDWQTAPFSKLQALPRNGKPIKSWNDEDEAFADIARGIRRAAEELSRR